MCYGVSGASAFSVVRMCFVKSANIDVRFENFEACDTFH